MSDDRPAGGQARPLSLTLGQQLRKLQLAVDHIAAVIDHAPADAIADLNEALDAIHHAESAIEDEREAASL